MPKREYLCYECDANFTINMPKGFDVTYCPSCGAELAQEESNEFEDD
jgi:NMD protein affecting ribosome stability and mRNA decay